jgi:hypothetical protein
MQFETGLEAILNCHEPSAWQVSLAARGRGVE